MDQADAQVVGLLRNDVRVTAPSSGRYLRGLDILIIEAEADALTKVLSDLGLELAHAKEKREPTVEEDAQPDDTVQGSAAESSGQPAEDSADRAVEKERKPDEIVLLELAVLPSSSLLNRSAEDMLLRTRYSINLLAVSRHGQRSMARLRSLPLRAGDLLLMQGAPDVLQDFANNTGCVPLAERELDASERDALLNAELHSKDFLAATKLGGRLGLIIARQLVRLMEGEFGIQSGGSQGSTLWLTLPLDATRLEQPTADLDASLQGARLLVVDDNDTCRKVLVQQCSAWGMQVSAVPSGKEAMALLRTKAHLREYFDAVLLDQDMPGMTGMQLAARIKEDANLNHDILVIMLTGISNAPSKIIARNAGIKRILAKPVAGYTLKTTLADELAQRGKGDSPMFSPTPVSAPLNVPNDFRILVAEDNTISTKVIRGMLGKLNLQPDTASNGEEALSAMKAKQYDLVLMDCEMPVLDGFSATEQLRAWEAAEQRTRTPVVALTAHILNEHKERARQVGMDGHMSKPVEMSQLRELIEHWVAEREIRRQRDALPS